jgi:CDP-diacylglycerol--serine O-phosphatidyltransferase
LAPQQGCAQGHLAVALLLFVRACARAFTLGDTAQKDFSMPIHDPDPSPDQRAIDPSETRMARARRKGIYALPNLVTLAALFGGFYGIVMAMNGRFDYATTGIFAAMVLDGLDGRVARMTGTQSAFGEQMDSLADMVSFGAAPALLAYEWALRPLGRWGWSAAFVDCAGAALRLARFNVNTGVVDKRYFQGLPSPAAAALVAGFIWLTSAMVTPQQHDVPLFRTLISVLGGAPVRSGDFGWFMFGITLFAGLTMVTNAPYYSFKDFRGRRSVPFVVLVLIALLFAVISIEPATILFVLFVAYALSGYVTYIWRRTQGQHASIVSTSTDEPDERGLHD